MIRVISFIIDMFGSCLSMILSLEIPDGNGGSISFRTIFLFVFLFSCAILVFKAFLKKGFYRGGGLHNGKD